MKESICADCVHLSQQRKHSEVIGLRCNGDESGRKWAISVARKPERCGDGKWKLSEHDLKNGWLKGSTPDDKNMLKEGLFA